jgi:Holliday junction resolvasome RuvABC endonuclease subunit
MRLSRLNIDVQALDIILHGRAASTVLPILLVRLPRHAASILRHAQLDPSCKLCSSRDDVSIDAEAPLAVLHALNRMAEAASYSQLQELLLRLLQLAASTQQNSMAAEAVALAVDSMCYSAFSGSNGNRW